MGKKVNILFIVILIIACTSKKDELLNKIRSLGYPDNEIVVSLDDFFLGNENTNSIGRGIHWFDKPSLESFHLILSELKKSEKVDDILVRIRDVENLDWPSSDTIYIISKFSKEELRSELNNWLYPDKVYKGWVYGKPINAPKVKDGFSVYSILWD